MTGGNGSPRDLFGKAAIVTGSSRGLGRSIALGFADAGASVVITSRKLEACEEVVAEIKERGGRAGAYACHVGHWDEVEGLVDFCSDEFGRLDILVNNAGASPMYPSLDAISEQMFDSVIGLNFKGPFRLALLAASAW